MKNINYDLLFKPKTKKKLFQLQIMNVLLKFNHIKQRFEPLNITTNKAQ